MVTVHTSGPLHSLSGHVDTLYAPNYSTVSYSKQYAHESLRGIWISCELGHGDNSSSAYNFMTRSTLAQNQIATCFSILLCSLFLAGKSYKRSFVYSQSWSHECSHIILILLNLAKMLRVSASSVAQNFWWKLEGQSAFEGSTFPAPVSWVKRSVGTFRATQRFPHVRQRFQPLLL